MIQPLQTELSKLLREQEQLLREQKENGGEYCHALERNNQEVWALRNKYACGSRWGKDVAFDRWWVKQVAKARNLNSARQILTAAAVIAVILFLSYWRQVDAEQSREYEKTHPDTEESQSDQQADSSPIQTPTDQYSDVGFTKAGSAAQRSSITRIVNGHKYVWTQSDNPELGWDGWHWLQVN